MPRIYEIFDTSLKLQINETAERINQHPALSGADHPSLE
jgi:hypothetical protein